MRLLPARLPTRLWMLATAALFVGLAALPVVLYTNYVLQRQGRDVLQQTLAAQAGRAARELERAGDAEERRLAFEQTSRLLDLRFALMDSSWARGDTARGERIDYADGKPLVRPNPETPTFAEGDSAAFRTVRDANGTRIRYAAVRLSSGGILEVGQPEPALFTLFERARNTVLLGMLLALFLAGVGAYVSTQAITRPLTAIRNSAKAIADGQYDEPIPAHSRASEFQDVAASLNKMSDAFRGKIAELEKLAHIQSEFIGNVSHEVRNPIFAIGGYLEALRSPLPDEMRGRYAENAIASLGRLQGLFNDLIEIARLEYREDLLRASVFDVQALVEEAGEMLRPKAEEKGLRLHLDNAHVTVRADRNRIRQVVVNLIENAIAYTEEGDVWARLARRGEHVRVEVIDTGRGIPEEHLDRIFDRFYRVDPDRARKSGGTGLGLAIVQHIMQAHGSQIHVESTVDRGTRFWFDLDYAEKPGAHGSAPETSGAEAPTTGAA